MNKFLTKLLLTIIGAILFMAFIWYRFIRERLPKDIPLKLSFLGFCILVSICGIFLYIVVSLIRQSKSVDPLIKQIVDSIYIPLKTFDHYIKKLSYTNNTYKYGINFLAYILGPLIIDSTLFYYLFMIIPRLILLTTLYIDIFWFHKLYYIYKILLIGSVIFLGKYIIYSFKYAIDKSTKDFKEKKDIKNIITFVENLHMILRKAMDNKEISNILSIGLSTDPGLDTIFLDFFTLHLQKAMKEVPDKILAINYKVLLSSSFDKEVHRAELKKIIEIFPKEVAEEFREALKAIDNLS